MKLSVLQWNVWFKENADNILSFIKEIDADVVCLQELTTTSQTNPQRNLPEEIDGLGYRHAFTETIQSSDLCMGNGVFSKFPIEKFRQAHIQHEDPQSNDFSSENRIYVEATLRINQKELTIGTVHMSYTDRFIVTERKQRELDALVAVITPNSRNFILTGDLNATPESMIVKNLQELLVSTGPDYDKASWTTKPFSYNGFEASTLDWRLDYIFTTPDIKVLESKIVNTDYSDHLPILATIEV
ncbi:MAG: endonuclease/exonuclease/phosphatase family protein [Candidatus Saccharimonadales bacterium]